MFPMRAILLGFVCLFFWPGTALARDSDIDPTLYIDYRVESDSTLTLGQVIPRDFMSLPDSILNPGYTQDAYWFRIKPPGGIWLIEVQSSLLDHVDLYLPDGDSRYGRIAGGDSLPFKQREINHRHPVFRIPETVNMPVYLRIRSDGPMQMPIEMWSPSAFHSYQNTDEFSHGIYYGVMIIMVAYNLFLYLVVRDRNYLNYVFYIGVFILLQAGLNGYGPQYLWPDNPWLANHAQSFLIGLVVFAAVRFAREFLDIPRNLPRFLMPMHFVQWAALAIMGATLLVPYSVVAPLANYLGLLLVIVLLPASIACAWKRYRPAYWFLIAWSLFLTGIFTTGLALAGHIPYQFVTANAMQLGGALEVLLLSLALADRIGVLRAEKEAAQAEANRHLLKLNENLETQVRERTLELTAANRALEENNRILADIARHDGLTGLLNHASFMSLLTAQVEEAQRYGYPLSLIMIDIDHFKRINDNHGHQFGDSALVAVAQKLLTGKRASDEAARYGGEEFALLLPHTELDAASHLAERLRQGIVDIHLADHGTLELSASFGVAGIPAKDTTTSADQLIKNADQALYAAKRAGRNRVQTASPTEA
jgi:two-component system, sensor histidine kinase LadS